MPDFYGSAGAFRDYLTARGRSVVDFDDDTEIDAALLVGSEWLDGKYRAMFGGLKIGGRDQVREWARSGANDIYGYAIPSDAVPVEIENATYEAAYKTLITPGSLTVDWTPGKYKSVSVAGAIAVQYAQFNSAMDVQTRFAIIDQILSPILTGSAINSAGALSGPAMRV